MWSASAERMAYDPWGKRRHANGRADTADSLVGRHTNRGYTLHEHLEEVGVIHWAIDSRLLRRVAFLMAR
jgi:hypothetical protein